MKIILASKSPRRKEILSRLDISFQVEPSSIIEPTYNDNLSPLEYCKKLSLLKAKSVSEKYKDSLIIGADTIVVLDKIVLGKPVNKYDAFKTLQKLSGKSHTVITAVTLILMTKNILHTFYDTTIVKFFKLKTSNIEKYIHTNSPYDKAGSYGIQDYSSIFVEKINGSYDNVVGFPLSKFNNETLKLKIKI